jgi:hypothetical protein
MTRALEPWVAELDRRLRRVETAIAKLLAVSAALHAKTCSAKQKRFEGGSSTPPGDLTAFTHIRGETMQVWPDFAGAYVPYLAHGSGTLQICLGTEVGASIPFELGDQLVPMRDGAMLNGTLIPYGVDRSETKEGP